MKFLAEILPSVIKKKNVYCSERSMCFFLKTLWSCIDLIKYCIPVLIEIVVARQNFCGKKWV